MRIAILCTALAAAALAAPALAQEHADHAATPAAAAAAAAPAAAPAAASGALSVDKTPIGEIIKNDKAKAALEKALPEIPQYYDQISTMTLSQVAPMSQGAIDDAKLKEIQTAFDSLK
jgi:hypothetical protein